jgi:hypothetical protein
MFPKVLRRDVILLFCIKAAAILLIYQLFFAPMTRPEPDGAAIRAHLLAGK